jgi:hypothetical protein
MQSLIRVKQSREMPSEVGSLKQMVVCWSKRCFPVIFTLGLGRLPHSQRELDRAGFAER